MKIRAKLTLTFTILVASIIIIFSFSVFYSSYIFREQDFISRLKNKGLKTARLLIEVKQIDIKLLKIIEENDLTSLVNEKVLIYDSNDKIVYSSDSDENFEVGSEILSNTRRNKEIYYKINQDEVCGVLYRHKGKTYVVITTAYDKHGLAKISNLKYILISGSLISVIIVMLSGWFYSLQVLTPISKVIHQVDNITINNINQRVNVRKGKDEISQLATTFNRMLDRLENSFGLQKSFVSNASHELRTPLTTIRGELEVCLMSEKSNEEYKKVVFSTLEEISSLIELTNGLLGLAMTEMDKSRLQLTHVRIDELVLDVISKTEKKYSNIKIGFGLSSLNEDSSEFLLFGNDQLLFMAILNLVENASKYSTDNQLSIQLENHESIIQLTITNKYTDVSQDDLIHLQEPMYRGRNTNGAPGHGIGLPLAKRILTLFRGTLELRLNKEVNHFVAIVTLIKD